LSSRKKANGGFVTRAECSAMMEQNSCDIKDIKKAIIGEDLRGGLVRDVGLIKDQIHEMQTAQANQKKAAEGKQQSILTWKTTAVVVLFSLGSALLTYFLSKL